MHLTIVHHNCVTNTRALFALKPLCLIVISLFFNTAYAEKANEIDLAPVVITGNPLGESFDELVVPVTVLNGRELSLRRASTLGETLNGIPGVTATQFGPNASRPVIRGLDAERVKIMQNGVGILDASSLSFDHAVGIDPLVIEQIEVVRGPAALLYGGSAVGGVVNAIDNRIPTEKIDGISGRTEARFGGAENQRNGAVVLDAGNGQFAIHADAYKRKTDDLDISGFAVSNRKNNADGTIQNNTAQENKGRLVNSSSDADGGALGASLTFDNGYFGASYSTLNNNYGTVAEEAVRINMKSDRWDIGGEYKGFDNTGLDSIIKRVKFRIAHTDYLHKEIDGGVVGTTFSNRGVEGNLEAGHAKTGDLSGVVGFQFNNTNFSALGEEAFVPSVNSQNKAIYVYEELPFGNSELKHKVTFGGRLGQASVDSKDNAIFGAGQNRSFNPNSYALGGLYSINKNWSVTSNLSHNERAPSYFELYANGPHLATGQFEVGNINFAKEKSNGIDAQLRWKDAKNSFSVGAYYTRFSNFIALINTGNAIPFDGDFLPEAQFTAVPAIFKGLEAEGRFNVANNLDLLVRGDSVHARDTRNNRYLPRIAPLRLGAGLHYALNGFSARIDALHAFAQNRLAENELATNGYTDVSALVAYKLGSIINTGKYNIELFAKANNLLNHEIREHASPLKDIAPAGERSFLIGARAEF